MEVIGLRFWDSHTNLVGCFVREVQVFGLRPSSWYHASLEDSVSSMLAECAHNPPGFPFLRGSTWSVSRSLRKYCAFCPNEWLATFCPLLTYLLATTILILLLSKRICLL